MTEKLNRKIDWNALFKTLRNRYMTQSGKTSLQIAQECNVRQQCMSSWCTGFGNRNPPNRLVLYLAEKTESRIVIEQGDVYLRDENDGDLGCFSYVQSNTAEEGTEV